MQWVQKLGQWWHSVTTPYAVNESQAAQFRAHQLDACLKLTPWVIVASTLNSSIVLGFLYTSTASPILHSLGLVWLLLVVGAAANGMKRWRLMRQGAALTQVSLRTLNRATRNAAMYAALWGLFFAVAYPAMQLPGQKVVAAVAVGMICAGGFIFAPIPAAAILYVVIMALGFEIGLLRQVWTSEMLSLSILLLIYIILIIHTIHAMARNLGARLVAEAESIQQVEMIGLLLNDFESHTSDWLWELNARGELEYVSVRMEGDLARSKDRLLGSHFIDLLTSLQANPNEEKILALQTLQAALRKQQPFKRVDIPVEINGQNHWWSLSAKPLFNDQGELVSWRGVGTDVTRTRRDSETMNFLANYDALTGLANRHQFRQQLQSMHARPCTLFLLDLDDFKAANDRYGHSVGDQVLQLAASRLKSQLRSTDLFSRLGGDEFALLTWGEPDEHRLRELATRLIECLSDPLSVDGLQIKVGTSIGIARSSINPGSPEELLQFADMALYAAKDAGGSTYCFFSHEMKQREQNRLILIDELKMAIERRQFLLLYQPQFLLQDASLSGVEALVRWNHPERGWVSPGEFIPIAEQTSLILPLGAWILEEACREGAGWAQPVPVAVNISAVQFADPGFVATVHSVLQRTGLPAHRLELEITESLLIEDKTTVLQTLQSLNQLGVRIALDDFGTGYSSLAYLRNFPLKKLKIDGAFVRRLTENSQSNAIVRTIIALGQALNLDVTAECIETQQQYDTLRTMGCTSVQGYWMAQPMSAAELNAQYTQSCTSSFSPVHSL